MSKSTIQQHLQLVASQMGASNNVTAGAVDKVRKAVSVALKKASKATAPKGAISKAVDKVRDSRVAKQAKDVASAAKQHIAGNGKKYSALAGVGAGAAGAYGANKLRSNEITAGVWGKVTNALKTGINTNQTLRTQAARSAVKNNAAGADIAKYKTLKEKGLELAKKRSGLENVGNSWYEKAAKHVGKNYRAYGAGAAGVGAAGVGGAAYNKLSAMEYFMNITAAEYLEVKSEGTIANSITAADYAEYNNISAMEYLIQANEDSAELAEASDDIKEALANADTEEEVAEILDANNDVKEAHAEKADEMAEIANSDSDDADEAAALAEFHAGKAQEAEDVENDVISALYYNN